MVYPDRRIELRFKAPFSDSQVLDKIETLLIGDGVTSHGERVNLLDKYRPALLKLERTQRSQADQWQADDKHAAGILRQERSC